LQYLIFKIDSAKRNQLELEPGSNSTLKTVPKLVFYGSFSPLKAYLKAEKRRKINRLLIFLNVIRRFSGS
jgi:hypothetical protein